MENLLDHTLNKRNTETIPDGLSQAEVKKLTAEGHSNVALKQATRSIPRIIFDNVFNLFNLINTILGVVVLLVSLHNPIYFKNLLFMGVVVANTFIYSFQEIRAKLTIDKLALLNQAHITLRREGLEQSYPVEQIVPGDVMRIEAGEQIPVDGEVLFCDSLEVDESLLTGEADAIRKLAGDEVLSGSVVMSGYGYVTVTKVAHDTFSARIVQAAKQEKKATSPLMRSLNKILKYISLIIFPLGAALLSYAFIRGEAGDSLRSIVSTAGLLVSMLPEGLVLLTSVALAVGVIRLGRVRALVQTVPSIETLARVDTLCLDKTGTITTGNMTLLGLIELDEPAWVSLSDSQEIDALLPQLSDLDKKYSVSPKLDKALRAFSSVYPSGNATQTAISRVFSAKESEWTEHAHVAFSSTRKWSAVSFLDNGSYYLGAAEMLLSQTDLLRLKPLTERIASAGYRVLMLAKHEDSLAAEAMEQAAEERQLRALGILVIADEIRSDAHETLSFFEQQGVDLKLISGDHPKTLEAIAARAGLTFHQVADMSRYSEDDDYSSLVQTHRLFGRVSPFQKRRILKTLQSQGHIVAMTGDGVNDVLALKEADCGVAMASGAQAARSVADIVLLDNQMARMVDAVAEGRRVINNIQRVASLFLIKTTYAILFALAILPLQTKYPILPIQGTIINSLTVGIPAFVLALKPNHERVMGRFLANVLPLAWPAGLAATIMLLLIEQFTAWFGVSPDSVSTFATFSVIAISLRALYAVSQPFDWLKRLLFAFCTLTPLGLTMFFPQFFMMKLPHNQEWFAFLGIIIGAVLLTEILYRISRTYGFRKVLRKVLGKSREDLLKEEQDRIRALKPKRLPKLRQQFKRKRRTKQRRILRRREKSGRSIKD